MTETRMLDVQEVEKSFSDRKAVDGLSFEVRPGEVFGFLGPNGAGKTTTLRMIMGVTRPDRGTVRFDGQPELDRRRVGYLPEERGLYEEAPVLDTLLYLAALRGMARAEAMPVATEWLERLALADRAKSKVGTLSKGNQQKIQFAAAVLHRPALVVLDEPFSGLDPLNQELFLGLISELRSGGAAVLLSAHQLNLVERLCDRFLLISKGRGLLTGTLEEIRRKAASGAGEVLTITLRPSAAGRAVDGEALAKDLEAWPTPRMNGLAGGGLEVEVSLPEGADLGPLLGVVGPHGRIERVEMHSLSLHEIYVSAVGEDHAAPEVVHA